MDVLVVLAVAVEAIMLLDLVRVVLVILHQQVLPKVITAVQVVVAKVVAVAVHLRPVMLET